MYSVLTKIKLLLLRFHHTPGAVSPASLPRESNSNWRTDHQFIFIYSRVGIINSLSLFSNKPLHSKYWDRGFVTVMQNDQLQADMNIYICISVTVSTNALY